MNLNVAHSDSNPQLSLPTGPHAIIRGGRRERTATDEGWYKSQFRVEHSRLVDREIYMRLSYFASLNVERIAYPSMARLARETMVDVRTAQRSMRRLEDRGLIDCISRVGGHRPGKYRVTPGVTVCHPRGDSLSPDVIRKGSKHDQDPKIFLSDGGDAQAQDPATEGAPVKRAEEVESVSIFPSQESEPQWANPKQVALLYAVSRKLGYSLSDEQALRFDDMEHSGKKPIIDRLLAEEQIRAAQGDVPPPPKAAPSPRHEVVQHVGKIRERPTCTEHRWAAVASDGIANCFNCDAERNIS